MKVDQHLQIFINPSECGYLVAALMAATLFFKCHLMRHGFDDFSPSSWEPQEEGMMSTAANFPSVRNQGLSV
jgi:hypothetical protein